MIIVSTGATHSNGTTMQDDSDKREGRELCLWGKIRAAVQQATQERLQDSAG